MSEIIDKRSLRRKGGPRYNNIYGWRKDKSSIKYKRWIEKIAISQHQRHLKRCKEKQKKVKFELQYY